MLYSRRRFLKSAGLTATGALLFYDQLFASSTAKELLGVQLYSVRDEMTKDPLGTLKALAQMGYKNVEHANYVKGRFYGYEAKEFRKILDDLGLKMPSGHTVLSTQHWDNTTKAFTDTWKKTVEDAAILGQQFVISPSLPNNMRKTYDDLSRSMEMFNKSGELCKQSGMKFGYHNHEFEFSEKLNDQTLFDIILTKTDPALVAQQLDIGNMYIAGALALDIMKKYPGRFESMHVKDEIKATEGNHPYESCVLGKGVLPVKEVIDIGRKSGGTIHFIVEQESYQGKAPLESMKENFAVMKKWGY